MKPRWVIVAALCLGVACSEPAASAGEPSKPTPSKLPDWVTAPVPERRPGGFICGNGVRPKDHDAYPTPELDLQHERDKDCEAVGCGRSSRGPDRDRIFGFR